MAGSATFDFGTDPTSIPGFIIHENSQAPWVSSGGNPGGFLAITYPEGNQFGIVVFPDIDEGKLVKAFKFEADLRVGNPTGDRAADGFSVNFARGNDPVLADPSNQNGFAAPGAAETGTTTGIAVSFDTWSGNGLPDGPDIEGIIVRVDNVTINRTALATRNGACNDNTTLQTGPRDADYWANGGDPRSPESWAGLCWQPFSIDLDEEAKLTVIWKGRVILDKFQTTYFPSVGRLILGGRTGGANEHTHFDNVRITTILADGPIVGLPQGNGCGFTIPIADAGTIIPQQNTITMTLNGTAVTPSISKAGDVTTLAFNAPTATPFASGSTNTIVVSFTDSNSRASTQPRSFVVPAYTTIPATSATTQFTASSSGFQVRVHQIDFTRGPGDANIIANAEQQLVAGGGFLAADGTVAPNQAFPSGTANGLYEVPIINWEQNAGAAGNFSFSSDPAIPDEYIPGIPGQTDSTDNIAAEILTFLELPAGCHTLGVNSDDGFTVRLGHTPFGPLLGSFNGGRGAADTLFRIYAPTAGVYPIRLSWWEGGGGANIEFFSMDSTGRRHLVNDRSNPQALKAYSTGSTVGRLISINPYPGFGGADIRPTIAATFQNGLTTVDNASIRLIVDGQQVSATPTTSGNTVTASFRPATPYAYGSTHSGVVFYSIGGTAMSNLFNFTVRGLNIADLGSGFSIEAEHFDFGSGQMIPAVNTMPYEGGEYDGLGAVLNVDYTQPDTGPFTNGNPDGYNYRTGIPAEQAGPSRFVPMDSNATAGTLDTQRPGFEVTTNYKIGWIGSEWFNYTRTVPAGTYKIVGAQSHGDPAGTADRHVARYGVVTSGKGTTTQSTIELGRYSTPASGGWGANLISVAQAGGRDTVIKVPAGTYTFRVWADSGDFDWFALVPTTETPAAAGIASVTPATGTASAGDLNISVADLFRNTTINFNTVKLTVNGVDVTSTANLTDTPGGVTLRYTPTGGVVDYSLVFQDNTGTMITNTGRFTSIRNTGNFVIEAEDFNYDSGKFVPAASTMPLQAELYAGLAPAVHDTDYHVNDNVADSNLYRLGENPNVPMDNGPVGNRDRGTFVLSNNYKVGWADNGEWYNYTRTFPAGTYNVFAGISHGGTADTDQTAGRLGIVTAGSTTPTQTVQELGVFRQAGPSGGWGVNRLLPLVTTNNALVQVQLSGQQTVRYTITSGDFDYLLFTPAITLPEDVTSPGDTIVAVGGTSPASGNENVQFAIDNTGQKYLNFGINEPNVTAPPFDGPVGLTVTPARGATTISGIRIYTANDSANRDPKAFTIEGSNDGTTFTQITSGEFNLPAQRNAGGTTSTFVGGYGQTIWFPNTAAYTTYRVMFQSVKDSATANSVQLAELELLGSGGTVVGPGPRIVISRSGANITFTWTGGGSLEASPVVGTGAVWTVVDSDGSFTTTAEGAKRFFRVRQ